MTQIDLESIYDALAKTLDSIGRDNHSVYLAKLALMLSRDLGNTDQVMTRINEAAVNFEASS